MRYTYIISYDLADSEQADYTKVIEAIKKYGTWAHITKSTWGIKTTKSASEIRDQFLKLMPEDSRIFVIKSGVEAAWENTLCSNKWLTDNL